MFNTEWLPFYVVVVAIVTIVVAITIGMTIYHVREVEAESQSIQAIQLKSAGGYVIRDHLGNPVAKIIPMNEP